MEQEFVVGPRIYRGVPVPMIIRLAWQSSSAATWWRAGIDGKCARIPFDVYPGQVYQDNDYRKPGRTFRVDSVSKDGVIAICTVLTNYDHVQEKLDSEEGGWGFKDMRGSTTLIKVRRLYPNARGYALISEEAA